MIGHKNSVIKSFLFLSFCFLFLSPSYAFNATLRWDANIEPDLAGYKIYYDTDPGHPYNYTKDIPLDSQGFEPENPEYSIMDLVEGNTYFFVVTAYNSKGLESGYSNEVTLSINPNPATTTEVTLEWDDNPESNLAGYKVYYKTGSSGPPYDGTGVDQGPSPVMVPTGDSDTQQNPQYKITGLDENKAYCFAVTAVDTRGLESDFSNEVCHTFDPVHDNTAPVISNILVASKTDTTATIKWVTDEGSDCAVQYGTSSSTWSNYPSSQSDGSMVTNHSINLNGLNSSTTYYFRVGSTDAADNGPTTSNEFSFTTDTPPDTTAPIISNARVISTTDTTALIVWTTDEPSTSVVKYGTSSSAWGSYPSNQSNGSMVSSHSITLNSLDPNTTYYFRVGSTDTATNGPTISNERIFTTNPPPDTTPPSFVPYPVIDYTNKTIHITFSEGNLQHVTVKSNYIFSPSLNFATPSVGGGDITEVGDNIYSLSMSTIPSYSIFTMSVSHVTDAAGNPLTPSTIKINDDDNDGMADDWEAVFNLEDPLADPDNDGADNYTEYVSFMDPINSDSDGDGRNDGDELAFWGNEWNADIDGDGLINILDPEPYGDRPSKKVTLEWDANTENNIAGYRVYYKMGSPGPPYDGTGADQGPSPVMVPIEYLDIKQKPSFTITGLDENETHCFVVTAIDFGDLESTYSNEVCHHFNPSLETTPPVISNIQITSITPTTAELEWTTDELSDSVIQYGTSSSTWENYSVSKSNEALVTDHNIELSGLSANTTYYFRVGSTDGSSNGPTVSTEGTFTTLPPPDTTPPSIAGHPAIDYVNKTIHITFSEGNLQHVTVKSSYIFSPSLNFATPSVGGDDITEVGDNIYRLSMSTIPNYAIFTMTVNNITDEAGNPVNPSTIKINDDDNDGMADDWEAASNLDDPLADPDSDGADNYTEYVSYTDPFNRDSDRDGINDGDELDYWGNSWDADIDGDGLINILDPDAEGDGMTDGFEVAEGYDPATTNYVHVPDSGVANPVNLKIWSDKDDAMGVLFRYQDADNYYRFSLNHNHAQRRLVKVENGVLTLLAEDAGTYVPGETYRLKILAQGTAIQVWIDEILIFDVTDMAFFSGGTTLYSWKSPEGFIDDGLIEDLAIGSVTYWEIQ